MIVLYDKGVEKSKFVNEQILDKVLNLKDTNVVEINEKTLKGFDIFADIQFWHDRCRIDE